MVQRPLRQAAKRANIFIQQQQSATPYMTQAIPTSAHRSQYSTADSNHHLPIQHHRIIVADGVDDLEKRGDGLVKAVGSMHYCPSIDSYPTVVVAENPYHIVPDEHLSYRGANYIYETSYSSPYYSVSLVFYVAYIFILYTLIDLVCLAQCYVY